MLSRREFCAALSMVSAAPAIAAEQEGQVRYVRPRRAQKYGFGDGSSYDNAWNGMVAIGASQWAELDTPGKSATLWVCGTHLERIDLAVYAGEFGGTTFTATGRQDGLVIRGDHPDDPGTIDTRGHTYTFRNRNIGPTPVYDQWIAGANTGAGAICASVNFWTACNVTLRGLKIFAGASPLNCTSVNNAAAKRMDLYYPPGGLTPCADATYAGVAIYYPQNTAIFSNEGSRNLRISGCTISGNEANSRVAVGLQGGAGKSSAITIDDCDISGFLKGVMMSFGRVTQNLKVLIAGNKIHDLGFADGDNDFVDGIVCYGEFSGSARSCEIVGNDVSGFYQDGIDLFYAGGVVVKNNFIHDAKLTRIAYMISPFWNADEKIGDQNGIKFGGDGSFGGNRITGNIVAGMLMAGISSNHTGNHALIANNLVLGSGDEFGGDGIIVFGSQSVGNLIVNNTIVGYKRGVTCESGGNAILNNVCKSAPKSAKYINGGRPQADILINGQGAASGNRTATNLLANGLLVKMNGGSSMDAGNRTGKPDFVNEAARDYRLRVGSPGAGTHPGVEITDRASRNAARPYGIGVIDGPMTEQ